VKCGVRGRNIKASVNKRGQNQEPRGRGGQRPQREERGDGCVTLLGRSHQGSPEAKDTLTMISHGVEISIAGGGADEKDEGNRGLFFIFFYFYIIYSLLRYKKSHGALAMAKTKPKIQNKQTKETSGTKNSSAGVRTGPRPTYGREIQKSISKETLPKPADSMKNNSNKRKPSLPERT